MRIFELPKESTQPGPEFQIGDEKFVGEPDMPAGAMMNLFIGTQSNDNGQKATAFIRVIQSVLDDDGKQRIDAIVFDPKRKVPLDLLQEIAEYLVSEYAERPSMPSSGSSAGSKPTANTPEGGSSENAPT